MTSFLLSHRSQRRAIICLMVLFMLSSCATNKAIQPSISNLQHSNHYENSTTHQHQKDSIYVEHFERLVHDTLFIRDTRYVGRVQHDTIRIAQIDTAYVERVVRESRPYVPRPFRWFTAAFFVLATGIIAYAGGKIYLACCGGFGCRAGWKMLRAFFK